MKKTLNVDQITNELKGSSAFFPSKPVIEPGFNRPLTIQSNTPPPIKTPSINKKVAINHQEKKPQNESMQPLHHDTTVSRHQEDIIETIRKSVKQLGKEAATYRFTQEEKKSLADMIYTFKSQGTRTSENEITRIALHNLIEDYEANGEESVLIKVLKRLNE